MAFLGKKLSDLTNVTSASANAVFAMVQDGQTVTAPVSALGCSLKNFTDVTMTSLDVASCMVAAGNIVGAQSIITQACANAHTLSARDELFTRIQYVQEKINVQAGLSAHGDIVTDTGRILSGGININDIITSRLSADKTTTTVNELLQNEALSSFAPITVTLSSNKGLSAENVYSGGAKVCTSESSNLSAVINRGACVPNLTIGLDKGLSGALLPGGGTGFCATSAGLIVGCNNTTPFSSGIDNDLIPGGGSPNIALIGGKNNIIGRDNVSFLGGSSNVMLTGYAGATNRGNALIGGFNSRFHRANETNSFGGENNLGDCIRNGTFLGSRNSNALSAIRPTFIGGRYGRIRTSLPPTSAQSPLSSVDSTIMFGVSNIIEDASDSIAIGGVQNILSGHNTENSNIIGGSNNMVLSSEGSDIIGGTGNVVVSAINATIINGCSITIGASSNQPAGDVGILKPNIRPTRKVITNPTVIGGECNSIDSGFGITIMGGAGNSLSGCRTATIMGSGNRVNGCYSIIIGGNGNVIPTDVCNALILAGMDNEVAEDMSIIISGQGNRMRGNSFHSSIVGGTSNTIGGSGSFIGGGSSNTVTASASFIGSGDTNVVEASGSFIGSGQSNRIPRRRLITTDKAFGNSSIVGGVSGTLAGDRGIIGGGFGNELSGSDSVVVGGRTNLLSGNNSFIGGGTGLSSFGSENFTGGGSNNLNEGDNSVIVGGSDNRIGDSAFDATVVGGMGNCALSTNAFIGGGYGNKVFSTGGVIGGGSENTIGQCSNNTSIVGGQSNTTCFATGSSFIGGGTRNTILSGSDSSIIGSVSGTIEGTGSTIIGGCNTFGQGNRNTIIGTISSRLNGENILAINGKEIVVSESSFINIAGNKNRADRSTGSSIQGGRRHFIGNGYYVSIVGGQNNAISATNSTIIGGANNSLSGTTSLIGGGSGNSLSGEFSTILGGRNNRIVSNTDDHVMSVFSTVINGTDNSLSGNSNTVAGSANNIAGHNNTVIGEGNVLSGVDHTAVFGSFNKMLSTNLDFIRSLSSENDAQDLYIRTNAMRNSHNSFMIGHALTLAHRNTTAVNNLTSQCFIRAGASVTAPVVSAHKVFSGGVQVCTEFNETLQELVARGSDGVIGGTDVATISSPLVFGMSGMNMGRLAISGHWQRQSDCTRGGSIEQSESLLTIGGSAVCLTEKSSINEAALRKAVIGPSSMLAPLQIGLSSNKFIEAEEFKSCGTVLSAGSDCIQELRTGSSSISTFKIQPNVKHASELRICGYEQINIVGLSSNEDEGNPGNIFLSGGTGNSLKGGDVIIAGGYSNAVAGGGDVCILPGQAGSSSATRGSLIIKGLSSAGSEGNVKIECMDALDLTCKTKITNAKSITVCHGQTNCLATISNSAISLGFPAGADSIFLDKNGCLLLNRDVDFSICTPVAPADRSGCDIIIEAGQAGATSSSTTQVGGNLKLRGGKAIGVTSNTLTGTKGDVEILADNINLIANTVSAAGDFNSNTFATNQLVVNRTLRDDSNTQNFVKSVSGDGFLLDSAPADSMVTSSILAGKGNKVLSGASFIGAGFRNTSFSMRGAIVAGIENVAGSNPSWNTQLYASDVVIGGIRNRAYGGCSIVGGGQCNMTSASGLQNAVFGGYCNRIVQGSNSFIGAGGLNQIGDYSGGNQRRNKTGYNALIGGNSNKIIGQRNVIGGGSFNCILTGGNQNPHRDIEGFSFIGGGTRNATYLGNSFIGGGKCNTLSAAGSFIGGGAKNFIKSRGLGGCADDECITGNTIVNGLSNMITSTKDITGARGPIRSFIGGGTCNKITTNVLWSCSDDSFIGSGCLNTIEGSCRSTILNGSRNSINSCGTPFGGAEENTILGGCCNTINGAQGSTIVAGCENTIHDCGDNSTIVGGNLNQICCVTSFIGGGTCNITEQRASFIGNGCRNRSTGLCSTIINGCGLSAVATFSTVIGGKGNYAGCVANGNCSYSTVIGGKENCASGKCLIIGGGNCNIVRGVASVIVGGDSNKIQSGKALAYVGAINCYNTKGSDNTILAGKNNYIKAGYRNSILGGCDNIIGQNSLYTGPHACYSTIFTGECNLIGGEDSKCAAIHSAILAGCDNFINGGNFNLIGNGAGNKIEMEDLRPLSFGEGMGCRGCFGVIVGGRGNCMRNASDSIINGGLRNCLLSGSQNFIGGGFCNLTEKGARCSAIMAGSFNRISGECGITFNGSGVNCDVYGSTIINGFQNEIFHTRSAIAGTYISTVSSNMLHVSQLYLQLCAMPTSDPGIDGVIWRDGTTLKISSSAG